MTGSKPRTLIIGIGSVDPRHVAKYRAALGSAADIHEWSTPDLLKRTYESGLHVDWAFFPHWRWIISEEILKTWRCVGFHVAPLPRGRGGSPIQNQIARGLYSSQVCSYRMTSQLDAGPVYLRTPLDLSEGSLDEILGTISEICAGQVVEICTRNLTPTPQLGEPSFFTRRKPSESEIRSNTTTIRDLYDHIRMLDGLDYPRAFVQVGGWRLSFSKARIESERVVAEVEFSHADSGSQSKSSGRGRASR